MGMQYRRRSWAEPYKIKMVEPIRMTIPRRVYTQAHIDVVAESVRAVDENPDQPKGLERYYEPECLRFFQARFKPLA